eukprot:5174009-Pyramimonas_sp.AAC.1
MDRVHPFGPLPFRSAPPLRIRTPALICRASYGMLAGGGGRAAGGASPKISWEDGGFPCRPARHVDAV